MATTPNGWEIHDADAGVLSYTYTFAPGSRERFRCADERRHDARHLPTLTSLGRCLEDLAAFGEIGAVVTTAP